MDEQWFPVIDDDDDDDDWLKVGLLSPAEERFLATLRQTLAVYDQSYGFGFSTYVVRTDDDYAGSCSPEPIIAIVDSRSATHGASFNGTRLICDYAHNQLFYLYRNPVSQYHFEAEGEPEALGVQAGRWFHTQLLGYAALSTDPPRPSQPR